MTAKRKNRTQKICSVHGKPLPLHRLKFFYLIQLKSCISSRNAIMAESIGRLARFFYVHISTYFNTSHLLYCITRLSSDLNLYIPVSCDTLPSTIHLFFPFDSAHLEYVFCIATGFIDTSGALLHNSSAISLSAA